MFMATNYGTEKESYGGMIMIKKHLIKKQIREMERETKGKD